MKVSIYDQDRATAQNTPENVMPDNNHRPKLLDLFCGAGGAAMGYCRAGFEVVGVDIKPQPHYPFPYIQMDAIELMDLFLDGGQMKSQGRGFFEWYGINDFDAYHASPPCQGFTYATPKNRRCNYPDLLTPTRLLLQQTGQLWVIENVPHAPMRADFRLCGCMFDLKLRRQRWFETSWEAFDLRQPCLHLGPVVSVVGHGTPTWVREKLGFNPTIKHYREAMGIDWMNREELSQAIPPAYTEYIGKYLMDAVLNV